MMSSNKLLIPSISLFFLGFVVTAATTTIDITNFPNEELFSSNETSTTSITTLPSSTDKMNITVNFSISTLAPQNKNDSFLESFTTDLSSNSSQVSNTTQAKGFVRPVVEPTPPPKGIFETTKPATTKTTTEKMTSSPTVDYIVIIILGVIIFVVFASVAICFFARKRTRRYSVVLANRADDANIPLSTVEPELSAGTAPQKDLQTTEGTDISVKTPEPEVKPETQETQKTEDGEPVVDPSSESAAPLPAPDSLEDEPKGDAVEQSSSALVKSNSEEKTDDEGDISNKTSVESLKETNENNNDNTNFGQRRDVQTSDELQEACVNSLV